MTFTPTPRTDIDTPVYTPTTRTDGVITVHPPPTPLVILAVYACHLQELTHMHTSRGILLMLFAVHSHCLLVWQLRVTT